MSLSRRSVLRASAFTSGAAIGAPSAAAAMPAGATALPPASVLDKGAHLVLLGTAAGPVPMQGRTGISSALVVDGRIYLIDLGHGAFDQFQKSGLSPAALDAVFVTHLHSDHLADLFTLLWLRFGGVDPLTHPLALYGPGSADALPTPASGQPAATVAPDDPTPGLADFVEKSLTASAYDINLRMRDENWPDIRTLYRVHEIPVPEVGASPVGEMAPAMDPFPVMSDDRVRVSAILVAHPPVFPSFAFRFDTEYGSVTFSGDTTITPNMVTLARHSDILVHEAIDLEIVKAAGLTPEQLQHHENSHSDVTRVGPEVARPAGVKTLVLSHLAPGTKEIPDSRWESRASKGFHGRVYVGNDLMHLRLGR